jgi:hypothetical protein
MIQSSGGEDANTNNEWKTVRRQAFLKAVQGRKIGTALLSNQAEVCFLTIPCHHFHILSPSCSCNLPPSKSSCLHNLNPPSPHMLSPEDGLLDPEVESLGSFKMLELLPQQHSNTSQKT